MSIVQPDKVGPDAFPLCQNCEEESVPISCWCDDCLAYFCHECARDLHQFKKFQGHARIQLAYTDSPSKMRAAFDRKLKAFTAEWDGTMQRPSFGHCAEHWDACLVYCKCNGPSDGLRPMIMCDGCETWFHIWCLGMSTQCAELLLHFYCDICKNAHRKHPSEGTNTDKRTSNQQDDPETKYNISSGSNTLPAGSQSGGSLIERQRRRYMALESKALSNAPVWSILGRDCTHHVLSFCDANTLAQMIPACTQWTRVLDTPAVWQLLVSARWPDFKQQVRKLQCMGENDIVEWDNVDYKALYKRLASQQHSMVRAFELEQLRVENEKLQAEIAGRREMELRLQMRSSQPSDHEGD